MHPDHVRGRSPVLRHGEPDRGRIPPRSGFPAAGLLRPGRPDPLNGDLQRAYLRAEEYGARGTNAIATSTER
ncbi:hypothetical protein KPATCC21470_0064 [Kitasatospora purpeofusca]